MKDTTPIYFHSATYAHEHGELDQYRASHKANIACKEAIEQAIADNYRDNRLGPACVQQVLQQFDPGRIFYVLANTVRQKEHDGRISRDNKAWAQTIPVCEDKDGFGYDRNVYHIFPALITIALTFLISIIILANKKKAPGTLTVTKKKKVVRKKGW